MVKGMQSPQEPTPLSKSSYVAQRLRKDIQEGVLGPGQPLRQTDLAKRYGVSQTPVREALRRLEVEGSVSYSPHKGATVNDFSTSRVDDFYRLRAQMEDLATEIAVERMTVADMDLIAGLHNDIEAGIGRAAAAALAATNRELHFAIYRAGSNLIADQLQSLWGFLTPDATVWTDHEIAVTLVSQHADIVKALEERRGGDAGRLMAQHVMWVGDHRRALKRPVPGRHLV